MDQKNVVISLNFKIIFNVKTKIISKFKLKKNLIEIKNIGNLIHANELKSEERYSESSQYFEYDDFKKKFNNFEQVYN